MKAVKITYLDGSSKIFKSQTEAWESLNLNKNRNCLTYWLRYYKDKDLTEDLKKFNIKNVEYVEK